MDQLLADLQSTGEPHDRKIEFGVMVEVPVLVSVLPDVLPLVDFISVGTNDLVQYLLAVDRDNQRVAKMYDPFHPRTTSLRPVIIGSRIRAWPSALARRIARICA